MVNAQEWLDKEYPLATRNQITELDISRKQLEGDLKLKSFINLEKFDCGGNKLTSLDVSECHKLKRFDCYNNKLTNLNLVNLTQLETLGCFKNYLTQINYPVPDPLNRRQLFALNLNDNNFPVQDLTIFSRLTNLVHLYIGNEEPERIKQGIYNRFSGSLEPLQNLRNLRLLDISNTDINDGVECLPNILSGINEYNGDKKIFYDNKERPTSKLQEISWQLDLFTSQKQRNWENLDFTLPEIRSWMEIGLEVNEYGFAAYLKKEKKLSPSEIGNNLVGLKEEYRNQSRVQIEVKK